MRQSRGRGRDQNAAAAAACEEASLDKIANTKIMTCPALPYSNGGRRIRGTFTRYVRISILGRAFELGQRFLFKHCIVIAYAVSYCLLPMQTPYYL